MKVPFVVIILACVQFVTSLYQGNDGPYVTLNNPNNSTIRGHYLYSFEGKRYSAFQGIPYATPPLNERRYKEAEPMKSWKGVLDTTNNTKVCPQLSWDHSDKKWYGTEDCLVLNVFTSQNPGNTDKLVPVLFFIHGGAFVGGSGNIDPAYLMDEDIVVVAINYRLGVLGFLSTEDSVMPPNLGLKDQRLALEWAYANIDRFGGDPQNIVIMGQSAGSASVGYQLLGKYEKPLFSGAILDSGSAISPWTYQKRPRQRAFSIGQRLKADLNTSCSTDLVKLLRNSSLDDLFRVSYNEETSLDWVSILSSEKHYSKPPLDTFDSGVFFKVPLLFGFTSEEELFWLGNNLSNIQARAKYLDSYPKAILGSLDVGQQNATLVGLELKQLYTNKAFIDDLPALIRYSSDLDFATGVLRHAESASWHVPVYVYEFSFQSSIFPKSIIPGIEGVPHGLDLNFCFKWNDIPRNEQIIRKRYVKLLTNFVKYKNPVPQLDPLFENAFWPIFRSAELKYMNFGEHMKVEANPRNYSAVKSVLEKYLVKPVYIY